MPLKGEVKGGSLFPKLEEDLSLAPLKTHLPLLYYLKGGVGGGFLNYKDTKPNSLVNVPGNGHSVSTFSLLTLTCTESSEYLLYLQLLTSQSCHYLYYCMQ
jgi:hypothetical protein